MSDATTTASVSSLRDRILSAPVKLSEEVVDVPEWGEGVKVLVIELTAGRRVALLKGASTGGAGNQIDLARIYPDMIIHTAHDPETKQPIFQTADRDALLKQPGTVIERLAGVASRLSGLDEAAEKAQGNG